MARIIVVYPYIKKAVDGINGNMNEYKKLSKEVKRIMTNLSCWSGEDKTLFCDSADKSIAECNKIGKMLQEYSDTIEASMKQYEECIESTKNKLKTV